MQLPLWAREPGESFWSRNYELAEMTEDTISKALEEQCQKWLNEVEIAYGKPQTHFLRESV